MSDFELAAVFQKRADWILFIVCVIFFLMFPNLDLIVANVFYQERFYFDDYLWVKTIYWVFAKISGLVLLIYLRMILFYKKSKQAQKLRAVCFLLVTLLIGPGLLVNTVLKNNSVGRPRPVHVQEFGGDATYTPVFHYSGMCQKNCSFVSGHSAMGFYFIALFWLFPRRRVFLAGLAIGIVVSFVRIVQGGHFLSDTVFAGWVVYFTCKYFGLWLKPRWPRIE